MNTAYTELDLERVHEGQLARGDTDINDFQLWLDVLGFELKKLNGGQFYVSHAGF
jgi:hypothetical protein